MLQMTRLLMHSADVPSAARAALQAAAAAAVEDRDDILCAAARILHDERQLACAEARELVGLATDVRCDEEVPWGD